MYSLGVNVQQHTNSGTLRGLWYTDGVTTTHLDESGTNQQFIAGSSTPVTIQVVPDGLGGANWGYSINGVQEASGNLATFDFSQGFRFVAYGQDDQTTRSIQSVSLATVPEPSSLVLISFAMGLLGLGTKHHQRRKTTLNGID